MNDHGMVSEFHSADGGTDAGRESWYRNPERGARKRAACHSGAFGGHQLHVRLDHGRDQP